MHILMSPSLYQESIQDNCQDNSSSQDLTKGKARIKMIHREDRLSKKSMQKSMRDMVNSERFPKEGPNNKVNELDLRVWETLFIQSLKIFNKWEQFRDIALLHGSYDQGLGDQYPRTHKMWIEFFWQKKLWGNLVNYKSTLMNSSSIKYQLYYIFIIIQEQENSRFDEVFKKVI